VSAPAWSEEEGDELGRRKRLAELRPREVELKMPDMTAACEEIKGDGRKKGLRERGREATGVDAGGERAGTSSLAQAGGEWCSTRREGKGALGQGAICRYEWERVGTVVVVGGVKVRGHQTRGETRTGPHARAAREREIMHISAALILARRHSRMLPSVSM
jgi:hypothetical protein